MPRPLELQPDTALALNQAANHDVKAYAYVALDYNPGSSCVELGNIVAARSDIPEAKLAAQGHAITFAKAGLASTELGINSANHRPAKYYSAEKQATTLPLLGTLVEWSDKYDTSLITALSTTASKGSYAPENTVQIYDGLLQGLKIGKMELPGYRPTAQGWGTAHNTRLRTLVKSGVVTAHAAPYEFVIDDPTYRGTRPFAALRPGAQAVFKALQLAKAQDATKAWSLEELLALGQADGPLSEASLQVFKAGLIRALSTATPTIYPGAVIKQDLRGREYSLNPEYREKVADLVERVKMVDTSPSFAAEAKEYALALYNNQPLAARVVMRGLTASHYRKTLSA